MRKLLLSLILCAAISSSTRADLNSEIESLSEAFGKVAAAIAKAPEADRSKLYDKLRKQVNTMAFTMGAFPDGADTIKSERSDEILVDLVYGAFKVDQSHLERAIIHTKDRELAVSTMQDRARCLIALFPICRSATGGGGDVQSLAFFERGALVQYFAEAYRFIPDSLVESIRPQMPRWRGEDRIPGLLVMTETGNADARAELEHFTSQSAHRLKTCFRVFSRSEKKQDGQKGAPNKSVESSQTP